MSVTPWFRCPIQPVRNGEYEAFYVGDNSPVRRLWRNGRWLTPELSGCAFGGVPGDKWRGLTKPARKG